MSHDIRVSIPPDEYRPIEVKEREPTNSALRCFLHKDDKDQLERIEEKLDRLLSLANSTDTGQSKSRGITG